MSIISRTSGISPGQSRESGIAANAHSSSSRCRIWIFVESISSGCTVGISHNAPPQRGIAAHNPSGHGSASPTVVEASPAIAHDESPRISSAGIESPSAECVSSAAVESAIELGRASAKGRLGGQIARRLEGRAATATATTWAGGKEAASSSRRRDEASWTRNEW